MRAATARSTSTKKVATLRGASAPQKPDGGYQLIPTGRLAAAWRLRMEGLVDQADLRVWFAAWEMHARRRPTSPALRRRFRLEELQNLTGMKPNRLRRSLRRLAAARLLDWSEEALGFPDPTREASPELRKAFQEHLGRFPRPGGRIPIPRRILRLLAAGVRPAVAATILGSITRCLRFRGGVLESRGRVKASWIAEAFGISERRVKEARGELIDLGWLVPLHADQSALNKWGLHARVDLKWSPPADRVGSKSSPPPAESGAKSSPLPLMGEPLTGEKNQEPAPGGPSGFFGTHPRKETPGTLPKSSPPTSPIPSAVFPSPSPALGKPNLRDVRREDLDDVARTLVLYDQAVREGLAAPSEWGRMRFLAVAQHARAIGAKNPCGLFARLVRDGLWTYATQDDEDEASRRLKSHLKGPPPPALPRTSSPVPVPAAIAPVRPSLSEDARIVQAVRTAVAARGSRIDPFLAARRDDPSWTRERWDQAAAELQRCRRGDVAAVPRPLGTCAPRGFGADVPRNLGSSSPQGPGA